MLSSGCLISKDRNVKTVTPFKKDVLLFIHVSVCVCACARTCTNAVPMGWRGASHPLNPEIKAGGCWEPYPGPLKRLCVFLTIELSLMRELETCTPCFHRKRNRNDYV